MIFLSGKAPKSETLSLILYNLFMFVLCWYMFTVFFLNILLEKTNVFFKSWKKIMTKIYYMVLDTFIFHTALIN